MMLLSTPDPDKSPRRLVVTRSLGFFAFVHNARRRGKALLGELVAALVT